MQIFVGYYIIAGLLTFIWFWHSINTDAEADDFIADVTWNTGIKREQIKSLLYIVALLLGWIILPYEIISGMFGTEEE